jgi:hypothetical protein
VLPTFCCGRQSAVPVLSTHRQCRMRLTGCERQCSRAMSSATLPVRSTLTTPLRTPLLCHHASRNVHSSGHHCCASAWQCRVRHCQLRSTLTTPLLSHCVSLLCLSCRLGRVGRVECRPLSRPLSLCRPCRVRRRRRDPPTESRGAESVLTVLSLVPRARQVKLRLSSSLPASRLSRL